MRGNHYGYLTGKNLLNILLLQLVILLFSTSHAFCRLNYFDPSLLHINPASIANYFPNLIHNIDFEDVPSGTELYNQYRDQGVLFPYLPLVTTPGVQTISGSQAITNKHQGEEFPGPIAVQFTTGQTEVGAYIGTDENTHGLDLQVYLKAYDQNDQLIGEQGPINFDNGPFAVNNFVFISSTTNNIWRVEFRINPGYGFYVDNLSFSDEGPAPAKNSTPPQVQIKNPSDEHSFYFDSFEYPNGDGCYFYGEITTENKLKEVTLFIDSGDKISSHSLNFGRLTASKYSFAGFLNLCDWLYEGENFLLVRAEDWQGNVGTDYIRIGYYPIYSESRLLIITPAAFREALVPLLAHKRLTGMSASIITLEAISVDQRFSASRDLPEKIKKAIAYGVEHYQTRYVMLVGDSDRFPVRYCRHLPSSQHHGYGTFYMPADLYYADLYKTENGTQVFDDWDENHNGYFGEILSDGASCDEYNIDQVDSRPDVAVGRVPASSIEEVETYVNKIISYENNYNPDWFRNVLLLTGHYPGDITSNDWIASNTLNGFDKIKHYLPYIEGTGNATQDQELRKQAAERYGQQINDLLNSGVGFVSYLGHGYNLGWGTHDNPTYVCCDHVPVLDNENKLPCIFAAACYTAQFYTLEGKYRDLDGNEPPSNERWNDPAPEPAAIQPVKYDWDACPEYLLVKYPQGAIAYIGCYTGSQEQGLTLAKDFFSVYDSFQTRPVILGDMWNRTLWKYYNENIKDPISRQCLTIPYYGDNDGYWLPNTIFHHLRKYMLYGDPSLRLGGSNIHSDIIPHVLPELSFTLNINTPEFAGGMPKITGHTTRPGTIEIYEGNQLIASQTVNSLIDLKLPQAPTLYEGMHHFNVYMRNQDGTLTGKQEINIIIDKTAPPIILTSYTPKGKSGEIVIRGITEKLARVQCYEGNQLLGSTIAEPQFANISDLEPFTLTITEPLKTGRHSFSLKAIDQSGNQGIYNQKIVVEVVNNFNCPSVIKWSLPVIGKFYEYTYHPLQAEQLTDNPATSQPFSTGDLTSGLLQLNLMLPQFENMVDVYAAIFAPSISKDILLIIPNPYLGYGLISLKNGLIPLLANTSGNVSIPLWGSIRLSVLPPGPYTLYVLVTPAGVKQPTAYYLWATTFTVQR